MCLTDPKYKGLQERLQKGGYSGYVISRIFDYLSANEMEKDLCEDGAPLHKGALRNTGQAKLISDYIEEVLGKPLREVKALQDEIRETQAKVFLFVNTARLARLSAKIDALKKRMPNISKKLDSKLDDLEAGIRRQLRLRSSGPTQVVGSGGGDPVYERLKAEAEAKRQRFKCLW